MIDAGTCFMAQRARAQDRQAGIRHGRSAFGLSPSNARARDQRFLDLHIDPFIAVVRCTVLYLRLQIPLLCVNAVRYSVESHGYLQHKRPRNDCATILFLASSFSQANVGDVKICGYQFSCTRSEYFVCTLLTHEVSSPEMLHPNRKRSCQSGVISGLYRFASLIVHACAWDSDFVVRTDRVKVMTD